ncbi:hypothetical protein SRHO_G00229580 [Serrasalmus rhombeus]
MGGSGADKGAQSLRLCVCVCVRAQAWRETLASPARGSYPLGSSTRHQLLPSSCAFIKAVLPPAPQGLVCMQCAGG